MNKITGCKGDWGYIQYKQINGKELEVNIRIRNLKIKPSEKLRFHKVLSDAINNYY